MKTWIPADLSKDIGFAPLTGFWAEKVFRWRGQEYSEIELTLLEHFMKGMVNLMKMSGSIRGRCLLNC